MYDTDNPFILLYVSTVFNYKNQINVVEAFIRLRNKGIPVVLNLIGGVGEKKIGKELDRRIIEINSDEKLITWVKGVELKKVIDYYHSSDLFIFASTCENMPNILIEAMASGLPIACSSSRPMPEFLENAGLYFNPENIDEIEETLEKMIKNPQLRESSSKSSFSISNKYSWENCADKTFDFLKSLKNKKNVKK
jgi:glycosyltransferase involved in cell wall biosynthesis